MRSAALLAAVLAHTCTGQVHPPPARLRGASPLAGVDQRAVGVRGISHHKGLAQLQRTGEGGGGGRWSRWRASDAEVVG